MSMKSLSVRVDRIIEVMGNYSENLILVKWPEKLGYYKGDRSFLSVEEAVKIAEKEQRRKVNPIVLRVVYKSPRP